MILTVLFTFLFATLLPMTALASSKPMLLNIDPTTNTTALLALGVFLFSYALVMTEEFTHLRKSKPVVIAAGVIWVIIAWMANQQGLSTLAEQAIQHNLLEYAELFLFLLVAMTYVNTMEERLVFESLRAWLVRRGYSYRQLFWVTGFLAFFISPIADNLTTALLMCAVVMAVGREDIKFVSIACVNIVVAANAGGAFSPFGDITTLMVWQENWLRFQDFFAIFIPALVSYLIPAAMMHFSIPNLSPERIDEKIQMKMGAYTVIILFLLTITTTIVFHNLLHLPPVIGMMTGLGYLNFLAYYIKKHEGKQNQKNNFEAKIHAFDIFNRIKEAEWDTLFFFYGVILSVGGLATLGYLQLTSHVLYHEWGQWLPAIHQATPANIAIGFFSAIFDNIPMMFAVLTMQPDMSGGQWLLVTLTAGIGGSILSIGSAAGVALMGQSRGKYTFMSHLKWSWVIVIGYCAGIFAHLWLNHAWF